MVIVGKYPQRKGIFTALALISFLMAVLCVALLPFLNNLQSAWTGGTGVVAQTQAYAESGFSSGISYSQHGAPMTSMSQVRAVNDIKTLFTHSDTIERGDVFLVVSADWEWSDVSEQKTPTLYDFIYSNASANMIETTTMDWRENRDKTSLHVLVLSDASVTDLNEVMYKVLAQIKTEDSLVLTNSLSFIGEEPTEQKYSAVVIRDTSDKGLFTSSTTRHLGLITTADAIDALQALVTTTQRFPAGLTVFPLSDLLPTSTRLETLTHAACLSTALQESQSTFTMIFVALLAFAIFCSAVLLLLEMRLQPAILSYLLPAARVMWILVLAVPLASYVMMLQLPTAPDAEICLDYFWFCTMEISFICILIALVFRWSLSYLAILAATVLVLVVDQLSGGPLSAGSYLSYAPVEGVRFYGIGNEGAALLFGAWVMLVSFYLTRRPFTKFSQSLRKWLYPLLSLVIIAIIAAPWWGANFGVIIWGMVGMYVSWRRFNAYKLHKREVVAAVVVTGAMALCVLMLDTTFNGESHMGGQINIFSGVLITQIATMFQNVAELSINTLSYSPVLSVLFFIIVGFLLFLDIKHPGPYEAFWQAHSEFHGAFNGLLITAILMLFIEDSGILMPALLLLYPLSGLMWFICNYHSWHIRSFIKTHSAIER